MRTVSNFLPRMGNQLPGPPTALFGMMSPQNPAARAELPGSALSAQRTALKERPPPHPPLLPTPRLRSPGAHTPPPPTPTPPGTGPRTSPRRPADRATARTEPQDPGSRSGSASEDQQSSGSRFSAVSAEALYPFRTRVERQRESISACLNALRTGSILPVRQLALATPSLQPSPNDPSASSSTAPRVPPHPSTTGLATRHDL